ncbi:MAG: tyrosine-type recombinase/integrase [Solirubrobacteraceae bacterium]
MAARRSYGTGSVTQRGGQWYGRWHAQGRRLQRKIGPVRATGSRDGLTKPQAEARLRRIIEDTAAAPIIHERVTVEQAGRRLLTQLQALGRKRSTMHGYESYLRIHLAPYFAGRALAQITRQDVEAFIADCRANGQSVKSTLNYVGLLHGIFEFAQREGWVSANPCKLAAKPRTASADADIHFLDQADLDALIAAVPDDALGHVEQVMYVAAAMTGARQGELLALRWMDVDWPARRIRIRRNYVRGEYGTPKSKRSTRSVPLADVLGGQLDRLHQTTVHQADEDLVFCHPHTGRPMDRSRLLKRYKSALKRAGVREVRFHDLRHTFGTRMAAAGVPMRTLQEWMGHRDFKTTLIYADYMPGAHEADLVDAAFAPRLGPNLGPNLSETEGNSKPTSPMNTGD